MSIENDKTDAIAQDNTELNKVLNELGVNIKNNPFFQMLTQVIDTLDDKSIFKESADDITEDVDRRCTLEYSYNEKLVGSEDKFRKVIADKLDDYTFYALANGLKECTIRFTFIDASLEFKWDNDLKHFIGTQDGKDLVFVYNELKSEFVCKDEYLKSLNDDPEEDDECGCECQDDSPEDDDCGCECLSGCDLEEDDDCGCECQGGCDPEEIAYIKDERWDVGEAINEETDSQACSHIDKSPCSKPRDTDFADRLYKKLNSKFQDDNFNKYKEDLIVAFHRIFDYEMYKPDFNDDHSEIDKVKFTLEDVLKVCPSENIGTFWDTISSQKIVGLIADEFNFKSVTTYLDQENNTHCVVCLLK